MARRYRFCNLGEIVLNSARLWGGPCKQARVQPAFAGSVRGMKVPADDNGRSGTRFSLENPMREKHDTEPSIFEGLKSKPTEIEKALRRRTSKLPPEERTFAGRTRAAMDEMPWLNEVIS